MEQGVETITSLDLDGLSKAAKNIRKEIVRMIYEGKSGHPGGSLSIADILAVLYGKIMHYKADDPKWKDRDRLLLSKGHAAPALYAALAEFGFFPKDILKEFRRFGGRLQGHPDSKKVPGVEVSTGSLGQGLSICAGMAWGAKQQNKDFRVYCILGDGEIQEGQIWEAAMAIPQFNLKNLTAILDYNNLQIDGTVTQIMNVAPAAEKFSAFGWHVRTIDGHNLQEIQDALAEAKNIPRPVLIVAKTLKGKGVSYFEGKVSSHHIANMSDVILAKAMQEIEQAGEIA